MPKPVVDAELRMSLMEHLTELRARLLRCTLAVVGLGIVSLIFAKPIFGLLMRPVLAALPADARSLVYTSGIEEINVLMKVGLYCGIFLSTPVILWQLWSFVAPGLYAHERKLAAPFVIFGSGAFIAGGLFCYFVLLPTMFQFLLQEQDASALEARLEPARLREQEALRFLRIGEVERAGMLAKQATGALHAEGDGKVEAGATAPADESIELTARLEGLGRLVDAAQIGVPSARPVLRQVLEKRLAAVEAFDKGDLVGSGRALDEAAGLLAGVAPLNAVEIAEVWKLEKDLSLGKARHQAESWTRPMLTMSEQLSLVLLLELAFGIIFELPLVMALLALVGVVKSSFLMKYQRHAFVVCMIAAAVITPTGDAINLALMAGPMLLCFELGVLGVWLVERRARKAAASSTAIAPPA